MAMRFSDYEVLTFERRGRALWVMINGKGSVNVVTAALHEELSRVFDDVQCDPDSDVIVITGRDDTFCAGGDIRWLQQMIDDPDSFRRLLPESKQLLHSLLAVEKPLVCRLNGDAVGLGASLALLCDLVVAVQSAKIGDPHVKAGLVAADGGAVIWPQLIGYARAKEFLLTGELLTASEAAQMGLINYAVPSGELDSKVDELVAKLLANPRWAVRWTKVTINIPLRELAARMSDTAFAYEARSAALADHQEAVTAFREKRRPIFTGN
jgi:enoyl-CoA hydratase